MAKIGGNISALLQVKDEGTKNAIGERVHSWFDVTALKGWLDLSNGDSKYVNFSAKIQESTHIFICDFANLKGLSQEWVWNPLNLIDGVINSNKSDVKVDVTSENARMVVKGKVYEILLIDNPMEMDEQLEIYLKYVGC
ncbi:MAG: hypothetical protein ACOX1S_10330 [Anaerostipes sp.]|jgi:hypothetical protein